ncbi:hypothetical protein 2050HW_00359 [Serratia phage vB_SmaM_ 2050HW]|uniref:Uncharacterized protein n=1 Tax=Serratia phage vB_SmaM_ 2050HW TaxID=2024252 RepID=A0A289ZU91_9CAUD|nr:hypothetical protein HWB23_gp359 [Serratia phage vB_SmaM_ 2050HW]ATA65694.1 hypothetical protein 2050HW_00359 [Serratia phage vB_SmaM_ 2050HW]UQT03484.1 hypothetical protein KODAMA_00170 [Serratia phage vB_SmaM-Kodama]URG14189.1 hypothetical protein [Pectobacterium phage vB_ParM-25]
MARKVEVTSLTDDAGELALTLTYEGHSETARFTTEELKPLDGLKYALCLLFADDWKEEGFIRRMHITELVIKYDITISKEAELAAIQLNNGFKELFREFPGSVGSKEDRVDALIQAMVADINTRALHNHQHGDPWTLEDCKKGADLGRKVAFQLKELL